MLGCSPDGIVRIPGQPLKLLEVKCPFVMREYDPNIFHQRMTRAQLSNFSLAIVEGKATMKPTHAHYYQVQMQMDIMKIGKCDYFVWSKHGHLTVTVSYDETFWAPKRTELATRHHQLLVPEYFLRRVPRGLQIYELD